MSTSSSTTSSSDDDSKKVLINRSSSDTEKGSTSSDTSETNKSGVPKLGGNTGTLSKQEAIKQKFLIKTEEKKKLKEQTKDAEKKQVNKLLIILLNIILPLCLVLCFITRFNLFSTLYLILFMVYLLVPSYKLTRGVKGFQRFNFIFVILNLVFSSVFLIGQIVYNSYLYEEEKKDNYPVPEDSTTEELFQTIGLEMVWLDPLKGFLTIFPDSLLLIVSIFTLVLLKKDNTLINQNNLIRNRRRIKIPTGYRKVKIFGCLILIFLLVVTFPSINNLVLLIFGLVFFSIWSFGSIKIYNFKPFWIILLIYTSIYFLFMYAMQFPISNVSDIPIYIEAFDLNDIVVIDYMPIFKIVILFAIYFFICLVLIDQFYGTDLVEETGGTGFIQNESTVTVLRFVIFGLSICTLLYYVSYSPSLLTLPILILCCVSLLVPKIFNIMIPYVSHFIILIFVAQYVYNIDFDVWEDSDLLVDIGFKFFDDTITVFAIGLITILLLCFHNRTTSSLKKTVKEIQEREKIMKKEKIEKEKRKLERAKRRKKQLEKENEVLNSNSESSSEGLWLVVDEKIQKKNKKKIFRKSKKKTTDYFEDESDGYDNDDDSDDVDELMDQKMINKNQKKGNNEIIIQNERQKKKIQWINATKESDNEFSDLSDSEDEDDNSKESFLKYFKILFRLVFKFVLSTSFYYSLFIVLICSLNHLTILNSVFMAFFVIFILLKKFARKFWIVLVIYAELVLLLMFIWNFSFIYNNTNSTDFIYLFGLYSDLGFPSFVKWNIMIAIFAVLQYHINKIYSNTEKLKIKDNDGNGDKKEESKKDYNKNGFIFGDDINAGDEEEIEISEMEVVITQIINKYYKLFFLTFGEHTAYGLVLLYCLYSKICIIHWVFLIFTFVCFLIHTITHDNKKLKLFFFLLTLSVGLTILFRYAYQFYFFSSFISDIIGDLFFFNDLGLWVSKESTWKTFIPISLLFVFLITQLSYLKSRDKLTDLNELWEQDEFENENDNQYNEEENKNDKPTPNKKKIKNKYNNTNNIIINKNNNDNNDFDEKDKIDFEIDSDSEDVEVTMIKQRLERRGGLNKYISFDLKKFKFKFHSNKVKRDFQLILKNLILLFMEFIKRLIFLHSYKLYLFVCFFVSIYDPNLINFAFLLFSILTVILKSNIKRIWPIIIVYSSVIILVYYASYFIMLNEYHDDDLLQYLGLFSDDSLTDKIKGSFFILITLRFAQQVAFYKNTYYPDTNIKLFIVNNEQTQYDDTNQIKRIFNNFKNFANDFILKFGILCLHLTLLITSFLNNSLYGIFTVIILAILIFGKKKRNLKLYIFFILIFGISLLIRYLIVLGLPQFEEDLYEDIDLGISNDTMYWLGIKIKNAKFLTGDFFILFFLSINTKNWILRRKELVQMHLERKQHVNSDYDSDDNVGNRIYENEDSDSDDQNRKITIEKLDDDQNQIYHFKRNSTYYDLFVLQIYSNLKLIIIILIFLVAISLLSFWNFVYVLASMYFLHKLSDFRIQKSIRPFKMLRAFVIFVTFLYVLFTAPFIPQSEQKFSYTNIFGFDASETSVRFSNEGVNSHIIIFFLLNIGIMFFESKYFRGLLEYRIKDFKQVNQRAKDLKNKKLLNIQVKGIELQIEQQNRKNRIVGIREKLFNLQKQEFGLNQKEKSLKSNMDQKHMKMIQRSTSSVQGIRDDLNQQANTEGKVKKNLAKKLYLKIKIFIFGIPGFLKLLLILFIKILLLGIDFELWFDLKEINRDDFMKRKPKKIKKDSYTHTKSNNENNSDNKKNSGSDTGTDTDTNTNTDTDTDTDTDTNTATATDSDTDNGNDQKTKITLRNGQKIVDDNNGKNKKEKKLTDGKQAKNVKEFKKFELEKKKNLKYNQFIRIISKKRFRNPATALTLNDKGEIVRRRPSLFLLLLASLYYFFLNNTEYLCYFCFAIIPLNNPSIISLVYPTLLHCFAIMTRPGRKFWQIQIGYAQFVIAITFFFQLDILCVCYLNQNSGYYSIVSQCELLKCQAGTESYLENFIGLYKMAGNFFSEIWDNLLLLIFMLLHREMMIKKGLWDQKILFDKKTKKTRSQKKPTDIEQNNKNNFIENEETNDKNNDSNSNNDSDNDDDRDSINDEQDYEDDDDDDDGDGDNYNDDDEIEKEEDDEELTRLLKKFKSNNKDLDEFNDKQIIEIIKKQRELKKKKKKKKKKSRFGFFYAITNPTKKESKDLYTVTFLIDFFTLIFIALNYQNLNSSSSQDIQEYISRGSMIPLNFILILLLQFALIVFDRAFYLFQALELKFIYQLLSVIVHWIILFFILPVKLGKAFNEVPALYFLYIIKTFYFLFSGLQVRYGYPHFTGGNILMRNYKKSTKLIFIVYMVVPFIFELRVLLDWICTQTTLELEEFIKLHSIHAKLFKIKCETEAEDFENYKPGKEMGEIPKLFMGVTLFIVLTLLIFGPILLMSRNSDLQTNLVTKVEIRFGIEGYQEMYHYEEFLASTRLSSNEDILVMCTDIQESLDAEYFQEIELKQYSELFWGITPAGEDNLIEGLKNGYATTFYVDYTFTSSSTTGEEQSLTREYSYTKDLTDGEATNIANLLENKVEGEVSISNILPTIISIPQLGDVEEICDQTIDGKIFLKGVTNDTNSNSQYWGSLSETDGSLSFYVKNADVPKSSLSEIAVSMGGIVGLYVGVIWAIARFLRMYVNDLAGSIMEDELPNVDMLLSIVQDILWAQKEKNLKLEEELFDELIDIFRSSEKLIYISGTRAKHGNYNYKKN
ncbi:hypothetical protein M0813_19594 [Anaeramoeba flamelloides]|uniref:Piezo non-specific cation channel R-Ras-binding domain-containing protein n=1 Tax=Anaeramoeba flamelloides TaxID=1746091 RepID=A0ABQ8YNG4_9EUKA|nr:hypothetical protein M0813_19594 [Anaeramoeba flamelloides]